MKQKRQTKVLGRERRHFGINLVHKVLPLLFFLCVLSISGVEAQNQSGKSSLVIAGKVIDSKTQESLLGVTITAQGNRSIGVVTDINGNYRIEVPASTPSLTFSFIGYKNQDIAVNARNLSVFKTVSLEEDVQSLNEVVVIGYGTQFKKNLTGSIAKVDKFEAENVQTDNAMSGLQGRVAGLWVKNSSGDAGSEPDFNIRGMQTTDVTNARPLIVLDGMIIDSKDNFSLNNIAPQDIASIEVLKDAASSAMYGSRGAMGVILITTKKGEKNKAPVVNVSAYYGFVKSPFSYRTLNNEEYKQVFDEARLNRIGVIDGQLAAGGLSSAQIENLQKDRQVYADQMNALNMGDTYVDWIDEVIPSTAAKSNIHISLNGGTDKTTYYFSVGRNSEDNSIGTGNYNRLSTKLSISNQTYKWLKLNADLSVVRSVRKHFPRYGANPLAAALVARPDMPLEPIYNENGSWDYFMGAQENPLLLEQDNDTKTTNLNVSGNFSANISLYKGLTWTSTLAGTLSNIGTETYASPLSYNGQAKKGTFDQKGSNGHRITANSFLNYNVDIRKFNLAATLGYEFNENKTDGLGFMLIGFPSIGALTAPGNGATFDPTTNKTSNTRYLDRSESYFFRANVAYDSKYLLSFSIRRDGSSKLPADSRYSNFPAVSVGWVISDEAFMKNQQLISFLKLRSSYGLTGSIASVKMLDTIDRLTSTDYNGQPALTVGTALGNSDLKWEKTQQVDVGLDVSLFNNRFNVTLEWYHKLTDGMLNSENLPVTSGGFYSRKVNMGTIRNRGLDINVDYKSDVRRDFTYEAGVNMNINRSKIIDLPIDKKGYGSYYPQGPQGKLKIGEPLGSLEMYNALGIDKNGDVIYEDVSGNGSIGSEDMILVNNVQPKFTGGLFLGAGYKGVSLYGQFTYTYGNKIYDYTSQMARNAALDDGVMQNMPEWVLDHWTADNPSSRYPRMVVGAHGPQNVSGWNNYQSTLYLFDASFMRLKKLTLAYDLPKKWLSAVKMNSCRVYVSGENLWTIKNKDLTMDDPELGIQTGISYQTVPTPISVLFGFDLTF